MTLVSHLEEVEKDHRMSRSRRFVRDWVEDVANRFAGVLLLIARSPPLALIALAIRRVDGAPVLNADLRVGLRGRIFKCLKLRTTLCNSDEMPGDLVRTDPMARTQWERDRKLARDPRVTGIRNDLRKTNLDELPKLHNVVRGEMVLAGPRPIAAQELTCYGRASWHCLAVRTESTGLWQVSGRNRTTCEERVKLDCHHVEHRSLWMDLRTLVCTIKVAVARDDAVCAEIDAAGGPWSRAQNARLRSR